MATYHPGSRGGKAFWAMVITPLLIATCAVVVPPPEYSSSPSTSPSVAYEQPSQAVVPPTSPEVVQGQTHAVVPSDASPQSLGFSESPSPGISSDMPVFVPGAESQPAAERPAMADRGYTTTIPSFGVGDVGRVVVTEPHPVWKTVDGSDVFSMTVSSQSSAVEIGGRIERWPWHEDVYWVRVNGGLYGFLPESTLELIPDQAPPSVLDLEGVDPALMLNPPSAVTYGSTAALPSSEASAPQQWSYPTAGPVVLHQDVAPEVYIGPSPTQPSSPGGFAERLRRFLWSGNPAPPSSSPSVEDSGVVLASPQSDGNEQSDPHNITIPWLLPEVPTVAYWWPQIVEAATVHDVPPELVALVMLVESCGGIGAHSPSGAVALMQVMPSTGAGIAAERGIVGYTPDQLWEPLTNIDFGAYYIAQQLRAFAVPGDEDRQQSVELAASAYNGGPGSVQRLLAGGALPSETVRYRQWVGGMWRERNLASSATFAAWSNAGGSVLCGAAAREQASK